MNLTPNLPVRVWGKTQNIPQPVGMVLKRSTGVRVNDVTYCFEPIDEWNLIDNKDLWVYNKLFLSRVLGYNCGPSGVPVPKPDFYVIRHSMNLMGMGRLSRIDLVQINSKYKHIEDQDYLRKGFLID